MIDLAECRSRLPLAELMGKLGMADKAKKSALCPFHEEQNPSFGIFEKDGRWYFKCQACGVKGDEVDLLQKALAIATKGEAIRQYANMAGLNGEMTPGKFVRDVTDIFPGAAVVQNGTPPNLSAAPALAEPSSSRCKSGNSETSGNDGEARESANPRSTKRFDRADSRGGAQSLKLEPLSPVAVTKLCEWRGLSRPFVENLQGVIGTITLGQARPIAFPVPGGFHYRLKDGSWRYTQGAKPNLFTLCEIEEGAHVHCFESPWDALTYADTIADSLNNIVATRGSQNARLLADRLRGHTGTLYLWPQNDAPGRKWAEDVRKLLTEVQMKLVKVPESITLIGDHGGVKKEIQIPVDDLNAWRFQGATDNQILGARLDAADFIASGAGRTGRETEPTTLAPTNFPVPVLADSCGTRPPEQLRDGEARESARNKHGGATLNLSGGENDLSGGAESDDTRGKARPSSVTTPPAQNLQKGGDVSCHIETNRTNANSKNDGRTPTGKKSSDMKEKLRLGEERQMEIGSGEKEQSKDVRIAANDVQPASISIISEKSLISSDRSPTEAEYDSNEKSQSASYCAPTVTEKDTSLSILALGASEPAGAADLAQTLDGVVEFLKRYVVFAYEEQAIACTLWLAHTWVYDAFDYSPILHIHAPDRGCGKSILLESVGLLSCRPELFVNTSETALFREINELHPTLLWDEIDNFLIDDRSPILGMLNAGCKRGGKVKRNADFGARRETFDVFCPKALTGIRKIPESLQSRSLSIRLTRESKGTGTKFRTKRAEPESLPIIAALQTWAIDAKSILAGAEVELPDEFSGRQEDFFEPLLAVADMAGGVWPRKGRRALVYLMQSREDISIGEQLLSSCRDLFDDAGDRITTTELLKRLVAIENANAPWSGWWESDLARNNTHGPAGKLAKMLKRYGIQPKNIRFENDEVHKGYVREDFEDAWKHYLPEKTPTEKADDETLELGL